MAASIATATGLLDHEVRPLGSEQTVNLQQAYAGKVTLLVNAASQCVFIRQYAT